MPMTRRVLGMLLFIIRGTMESVLSVCRLYPLAFCVITPQPVEILKRKAESKQDDKSTFRIIVGSKKRCEKGVSGFQAVMRKSLELRPERTWTVNTICKNPCDQVKGEKCLKGGI